MNSRLRIPVVCALLFLATAAAADASDGHEGKAPLVRPDGAPDPDAYGKVKIESEADGDEFEVEIGGVDSGLAFELFVEDAVGSGTFVSAGAFVAAEHDSERKIEFDTEDGDLLPAGAATAEDLVGRGVEVRSSGVVYLEGVVPGLDGEDHGGKWLKAKSPLMRTVDASDSDEHGSVGVAFRAKDNRQRFSVEVDDMPDLVVYSLFLEDPIDSGLFVEIGALMNEHDGDDEDEDDAPPPAKDDDGDDEDDDHGDDDDEDEEEDLFLSFDTGHGDALPLGVVHVDELAGRRVEIRGDDATTYLVGLVPSLADAGESAETAKSHLGGGAAKGLVKLSRNPKKGGDAMLLKAAKLPAKKSLVLLVENDVGNLVTVATLATNGGGKAQFRVRTKKGDPLPHGKLAVEELSGRKVEICDPATSDVLLSGVIPEF